MIEETEPVRLPPDHAQRMERALLSLEGLSVGDGFGDQFFTDPVIVRGRVEGRHEPPPLWRLTDDSIMAIAIVRSLRDFGFIHQDRLAEMFAEEYAKDPGRGYGGTAHTILCALCEKIPWEVAAGSAFNGQGSCGNGGAMRAAPIGAYFADSPAKAVEQARLSAAVTHAHPEGQAGAMAIAAAAVWATNQSNAKPPIDSYEVIRFALDFVPAGDTRVGMEKALKVPLTVTAFDAAVALGNGSKVISADTVPYCLWCIAKNWRNYPDAIWATVSGFGDRDTTCAIVGGIVAMSAGRDSIPQQWIKFRETFIV